MKHPPLLLATGLILWGWQNDQILFAVLMAAALEYAQWSNWRWNVNDQDFNRIADFTSVFFILFAVYQFSSASVYGIFNILTALPYLFFPLLLSQLYSQTNTIQVSALFLSLRQQDKKLSGEYIKRIDLTYPYLLICILAASVGNQRTIIFYIAICLIMVFALASIRPKRYHINLWILMLIAACLLGYTTQKGLLLAHAQLESLAGNFLNQMLWRNRSADKTNTAIGSIGRLKLSDQIHVRVKTKGTIDKPLLQQTIDKPLLLREASYTKYAYGIWSNDNNEFSLIDPDVSGREWILGIIPKQHETLTVSAKLIDEKGIIPVPHGTYQISDIAAVEINRNKQGAIELEMKPGWVKYDVHYGNNLSLTSTPTTSDLHIHKTYEAVIRQVAMELGLHSKSPNEIVATIENYFKENFTYTLIQGYKFKGGHRLADFLLHRKKGHCEYFATATTLLLRAAGIPARYTLGYSVQEYSQLEGQYIARARDAHSWVTAYVDGKWEIIDTTPSIWASIEAEGEPWWLTATDFWSWLNYLASRWKNRDQENDNNKTFWGIAILLFIYLAWRLYHRKQSDQFKQVAKQKKYTEDFPGMDSPLYELYRLLGKQLPKQCSGETLRAWLNRIKAELDYPIPDEIIEYHYRYRFDQAGLNKQELDTFKSNIQSLIDNT